MTTKPSLKDITNAIVQAYASSERKRAFELSCMAVTHTDAGHLQWLLFADSASGVELAGFDPNVKVALGAVLQGDGIDFQKLSAHWGRTVLYDPAFAVLQKEFTIDTWPEISTALSDPFLSSGLCKMMVTRPALEKILVRLRRFLLLEAYPNKLLKTKDINFLSALAQQCFLNEYVYVVTKEEESTVQNIPADDPIAVCLIGCYEPLSKKEIKPKLSAVAGYKQLMKIQVEGPASEAKFLPTIERLGNIADDVSKNVQAMYEQNPYPRWIYLPTSHKIHHGIKGTMLVGGCGTGKPLLQVAHAMPNLDIHAVDITRASISYAMARAEEHEITNIRFSQCDIMALDVLEEKFDFIESSGVLHHMADPQAGWGKLVDRLKDGGLMLIALYSTNARVVITEVRNYVKEKGYKPDIQGIRALRAEIMNLPEDHRLYAISNALDFYSASDIRDLVFHVQEATYSPSEIKKMMEALGLEFITFKILHPMLRQKYPNLTDLDEWDAIEKENPKLFYGMYEFLCKKKGEPLNETAQKILTEFLNLK